MDLVVSLAGQILEVGVQLITPIAPLTAPLLENKFQNFFL